MLDRSSYGDDDGYWVEVYWIGGSCHAEEQSRRALNQRRQRDDLSAVDAQSDWILFLCLRCLSATMMFDFDCHPLRHRHRLI